MTTAEIRWWASRRGSGTRWTGHGWPEEQSSDDARSLTFTSDPLPEPLLVAGAPEADLYLDLPPDTELNLVARVCMVSPDGRSTLITRGWVRIPPDGRDALGRPDDHDTLGAAAFELPGRLARYGSAWPALTSRTSGRHR